MTQNNVVIAVTGGIGSGKSAVCKIIKEAGFPVISCDGVYSELLNDGDFLSSIANEYENVLTPDSALDRKKLAEIVFNDKSAKEKLENITHPAIINEVLSRAKAFKLCFCEVPLLFEKGFENLFDNVIVVLRQKEARINSVQQRDNIDRKNVLLRIKNQINYEKFDFAKYYVIHNDGNLNDLKKKTVQILEKITLSNCR